MWLKVFAASPLNHDFGSTSAMNCILGWDTLRATLMMESSSFSSLNISHHVVAILGSKWTMVCQMFVLDVSPKLVAKSIHQTLTVAVRQLLRLSLKFLLEVVNLTFHPYRQLKEGREKRNENYSNDVPYRCHKFPSSPTVKVSNEKRLAPKRS